MFKKILVTLENGPADKTILPHAKRLAKQFGSVLLLLHVADGWVARNFHQLKRTARIWSGSPANYARKTWSSRLN
jgi:nucleotide-binding universal stress UspA family protein